MAVIFFSWQSDLERLTHKNLIHRALEQAIRILKSDVSNVEDAERPDESLELQSGVVGVGGSPHIASTILERISNADVFVADLTSIATRPGGTGTPNPNVMLEYGYALAKLSNNRMIAVINSAFCDVEDLPFDLKHLRFPIAYNVPDDAAADVRKAAERTLARDLATALKATLDQFPKVEPLPVAQAHNPIAAPQKKSRPWVVGKTIGVINEFDGSSTNITLAQGADIYLRLMPINASEPLGIPRLIQVLKPQEELLKPLGREIGQRSEANEFGFLHYGLPTGNGSHTNSIVQVFRSGEIWAIHSGMLGTNSRGQPLPIPYLDAFLPDCLEAYRERLIALGIVGPYRWIAGMTGIQGRALMMPPVPQGADFSWQRMPGACLVPAIEMSGIIDAEPAAQALEPFIQKVWDECQVDRQKILTAAKTGRWPG